MQIHQGEKFETRFAQSYAGASNRVKHPGGHGNNYTLAKLYIKTISVRVA
jgi:hypothetical protein